eukprot:TRINITY_DN6950_c0_g2_i2.p1 TRINITY_DN6950_c0_g2~~TRINITY_DN6950_c0_g2_i2.p1  ORF type:complete len:716 (+),score=135.94 TRINITY_DN6950_c0_g2_i2:104-2251(+)
MGVRQSCGKACANCTADCTRTGPGYGDEFDDTERPSSDPAGATFEETLEDLNSLDRHLMLFCASSNLSAVRWLLYLGAHWDTCDANGTTCLHVACRSGALAIVSEMLLYEPLLEATDVAGWTALHIAVLMGRRQVVSMLLQSGSPLLKRNSKGQLPTELCADGATHEVMRAYEVHLAQTGGKVPWTPPREDDTAEDLMCSRLQYEPFFVPRQPVVRSQQFKKDFQKIGILIFNRQPGFGLAFLVASGVARDYPVDMSAFLRKSKVDIKQVGSFLGEAYSLSHTIRLEFVNSVVLQHTGVVSALAQVFHMLRLPDDLQKINRLVHGVARIWWRQHERLVRDLGGSVVPPPAASKNDKIHASAQKLMEREELRGLELKQYITSSDALHQLMFSTIILHWYMYKDYPSEVRSMDFAVWRKLNEGIETGRKNVPEHVQLQVYNSVLEGGFIADLAVAPVTATSAADAAAGSPDQSGGQGPGDDRTRASTLSHMAAIEGWTQIVGGGFPKPTGTGVQTLTYQTASNMFSEATMSSKGTRSAPGIPTDGAWTLSKSPGAYGEAATAAPASATLAMSTSRDDFAWLSLCHSLLFFCADPAKGAPYAFLELQRVSVLSVQPEARVLTLVGAPEDDALDGDAAGQPAQLGADLHLGGALRSITPITLVMLLPDGRWQELALNKLELRLPTMHELNMWSTHLIAACSGKVAQPPGGTMGSGIKAM